MHIQFLKKIIYFLFGDGAGQMLFSEYDQVTLKERKAFRLHVMRTLSSQHRSFKPCSGHMHWLLIQVCVLISFSYVFLQAYVYKTDTCVGTTFGQQTC